MNNIIKYLGVLILVVNVNVSFAQPSQTQKFLPVFTPESPEAAAFSKYGSYDVNLFTGIPNISIPLYEVTVGELKVPISLNYHASGIRVSDMPSRMGAGWDLQAGGSITRKVMGKPDEINGNYLSATPTSAGRVRNSLNMNLEVDLQYLNDVDLGFYDVEPDLFSYSFPGHGGKFLFNQKNNFAAFLIPYSPIAVNYTRPTSSTLSLRITDEKGINYKFDSVEWTNSGSTNSITAPSAWMLSDMISANNQDSIHFKYYRNPSSGLTDKYYSDYAVVDDNSSSGPLFNDNFGIYYTDNGSSITSWQQLTEINFKNGKIVFEAAPETRLDFSAVYKLQNRLIAIRIYSLDAFNRSYTLVKSIQFFHSYFINGTDADTKRLRLDSMQVLTGGGSIAQTYRFNYNTSITLPVNTSTKKDYWGYFNNKNNLRNGMFSTLMPQMVIPWNSTTITIGGNLPDARDPDPAYMQAAILQKITFPTGGFTVFEFETNKYLDAQSNPKYAGGLRIRSIKSYTDVGAAPLVKTYQYGPGESGYGRNNFLLEKYFFVSTQTVRTGDGSGIPVPCTATKRTRTFFANPTNDLEGYDGAPVVYANVTEYIGDGTANSGKTQYTFNDVADARTDLIGYGKPYFDSYHFVRGLLTNKSDYRRNADNSYSIIAETRNTYQYFANQFSTGGAGLVVFKHLITQIGGNGNAYCGLRTDMGCVPVDDQNSYYYNNYDILTGDNKIVSSMKISYDQNDPTKYNSITTNYTYDDVTHNNITQIQTTDSKNQPVTTNFTYPYNYATAPYTLMTTAHIFSQTVSKTEKLNGNVLSVMTNNYAAFAGNNYLPGNIQFQVKSNPVETRASFNFYDNRANVLEMQKTNDVKQSFIWDYQTMQLVAQVSNSSQSDIAYTSFESDGNGNWTYAGIPFVDATSHTGKRCFKMAGNITKSGLSSTTTYVVSYWRKSGTLTINGTSGNAGRTSNGWTYYEHIVANPAGGTMTLSGTGSIIDELRLYPANAQMTTYAYQPLVGLTSQCDVNNRITYYEYDGIGRLLLIRDLDKNIIKKVCYNYAGQTGNCNLYYNAPKSGNFTKGCPVNFTGSSVTYTVPANLYVASTQPEADLLAQNDVNANGQQFADSNGVCTASITIQGYNVKSASYNLRFTDNSTSIQYNFILNANQMATITLGQIPKGTYTVLFYPAGAPVNATFGIAGLSFFGTGATFNNVVLNAGATASINN